MKAYEALVRRAAAACETPKAGIALITGEVIGEIPNDGWVLRVPLKTSDGVRVGELAVGDDVPRRLSREQIAALHDLAVIAQDLADHLEDRSDVFSHAAHESLDFVLVTDFTPPSRGGPYIEYANAPFLRATGFAAEDIVGKPFIELLADGNEPLALASLIDNFERARDSEKEVLVRRQDGTPFWVELTARPLRRTDGSSSHWVAVTRDITSRRRAHEQLAALVNAIDAVEHHIEIYSLEDGQYRLAFQNAAAHSDTSELLETLFSEQELPGITPLREQLKAGQSVTITPDGLQIRPLGKHAETLICIKQTV